MKSPPTTARVANGAAALDAPSAQVAITQSAVPEVIIASDVRILREGLALGLAACEALRVAGTAATFEGVCALLASSPASVILLDVGMPDALNFARRLTQLQRSVRIVAVAVADLEAEVVACAEAGFSGFVSRDASIADAALAIHGAAVDELHCSPRLTAQLFKRLSVVSGTATSQPSLTRREAEVVDLIDRGLSNKQISQRLHIGTATVKNHVHNVLEKLHVSRRAEAAAQVRGRRSARAPLSSNGY